MPADNQTERKQYQKFLFLRKKKEAKYWKSGFADDVFTMTATFLCTAQQRERKADGNESR